MSGLVKRSLAFSNVPLTLYEGPFDAVASALGTDIRDKTKPVLIAVDVTNVDCTTRLLAVDDAFGGDVDGAKSVIPLSALNALLEGGYRAVTCIAALDHGTRYASVVSGFSDARVDHGTLLRKLGKMLFDDRGCVLGSNNANTLFLYSPHLSGRTDFAWSSTRLRAVPVPLDRGTVRHTVIGRAGVMVAAAGDNRAVLASAEEIAAFVEGATDRAYPHSLELAGRIVDLALASRGPGNTYGVVLTNDRQFVPLQVTFRDRRPTVHLHAEGAVDIDGTVRDLGGAVKVTDRHVVFFGQRAITFVPIEGLRDPFRAFFSSFNR